MKNRYHLIIIICQVLLAVSLRLHQAQAQEQGGWPSPSRLSTERGNASEAYLVTDSYGYVHVFWTEELEDERVIIQYARYEGETWSVPIDIRVTPPFRSIANLSPSVDSNGTLHLVWSENANGPAFYTSVPAHAATSAQNWQQSRVIKVPADQIELQVDARGFLHILYIKYLGQEQGVYYIRSEDQGANWSEPLWLDPDILFNYVPRALNFEIDESGSLHAVWYYNPFNDIGGDWVRYIHSLDGGDTWSQPFTIDRLNQYPANSEVELSAADPVMAVQGQNVHVIWAGGTLHYRHHRLSTDSGRTWGEPVHIFGELNGQAGDGLAVDGQGRLHFFGQIRFPMGIYHAIWEEGEWSRPSLIYLIRYSSEDPIGDQIGAHATKPAVRAGNQLLLTLVDPPSTPGRRLFFMKFMLDDVAPLENAPLPVTLATSLPLSTLTPQFTPTEAAPSLFIDTPPAGGAPAPGSALWSGLIPTLLLTGGMIIIRLLKTRH